MSLLDDSRACGIIKEKYSKTKIIVLASFEQGKELIEMTAAGGANGYLIKQVNKSELMNALTTVTEGLPYYCATTTKIHFDALQTNCKKKKILSMSRK